METITQWRATNFLRKGELGIATRCHGEFRIFYMVCKVEISGLSSCSSNAKASVGHKLDQGCLSLCLTRAGSFS